MMLKIFNLIIMIIMIMVGVAFLTLLERKVLGYMQIRKGPNKVGMVGILQPFSDFIKMMNKEFIFLFYSNKFLYLLMPLMMLMIGILGFFCFPIIENLIIMDFSLIYMICLLSMMSYPIIFMSWSSNSNYSLLSSVRSIAQMISYEISLILIMMNMVILMNSFSFMKYLKFQLNMFMLFLLFPIMIIFFISMLAELNRIPFDYIEGESELVSGFNIEFFGLGFIYIFLSEYMMIIFMSLLFIIFFINSIWFNSFLLFYLVILISFFILLIRGLLPRLRYDELMNLCWKIFLFISINYLMFILNLKLIFLSKNNLI